MTDVINEGQDAVEAYEGENDDATDDRNIYVNLVYVDMKQSIPALYSKNPKIFFDPENPSSEKATEILELIVNQAWDRLKMRELMRESIKLCKLYGVCGYKTYYNFSREQTKTDFTDRVVNDDVRTDVISIANLLKSPDCTWNTSPYIIHVVNERIDDIAVKFNLNERDRGQVTITKTTSGSDSFPTEDQGDFQFGTYYEIEDRANGLIGTLVEGLDRWVKKLRKKDYKYDSMYDFLMYNDIPNRPNVKNDFTFWADQLKEVTRYRTMQVNHAKKGNSKYLTTGPQFSPEQLTQVRSAEDTSIVNLKTGQNVIPMQHAPLDPQIPASEQAVRGDIQLISRQAPRQTGGDKTATEVKANEAAAVQVTSENLSRLEDVSSSIGYKMAKLMQDNYSTTRVISLTEMPEAKFMSLQESAGEIVKGKAERPFLEITKENIQGEFRTKVQQGSTLPDNEQTRISKLQGFIKAIAALPGLPAQLDMQEVIKEMELAFDVRNENLLIKKDNPMEESRLLNDGVLLPARITEDHDKHLMVHDNESNGNSQNILHKMMHEEFKKQIEGNLQAEQAAAAAKGIPQAPTGQSFLGPELPGQEPLPAQGQPVPAAPQPGGVPPQGGIPQ